MINQYVYVYQLMVQREIGVTGITMSFCKRGNEGQESDLAIILSFLSF